MLQNLLFNLAQRTLNPDVRRRVEGTLVTTALVLFGLHLALYGMHAFWGLGLPDSLFAHPLQTLYTPFSVILIAEVYLLVYYLPTSFARSLGKQVEIVALIEIRSVFKDLDATSSWPWEATFFPHMLSALVLGGMLVLFYHLLPRRKARIEESELKQFVRFKTALAGLLAVAFVVLSVYSLGTWLWEIVTTPDHLHSDLNHVFYNEFFTALISGRRPVVGRVVPVPRRLRHGPAQFGLHRGHHPLASRTGHRTLARLGLRNHSSRPCCRHASPRTWLERTRVRPACARWPGRCRP